MLKSQRNKKKGKKKRKREEKQENLLICLNNYNIEEKWKNTKISTQNKTNKFYIRYH